MAERDGGMSMASFNAERRLQRRTQPAATGPGMGLEQAWMRIACPEAEACPAPSAPVRTPRTLRTPHQPHAGYRASLERRKRHPAVVSRLRAAQHFSRPERRDVPHA